MRLCLLVIMATPAMAQGKDEKIPPRPKMPGMAPDTNSAKAYYEYGVSILRKRPVEAGTAFYWAMRLDPASARAYSARRIALLLEDHDRLWRYLTQERAVRESPRTQAIDSLELKSRLRDPFMHRKLDIELLDPFVQSWVDLQADASNGFRGWVDYSEGRFPKAAKLFAAAAKSGKYGWQWRMDRAQTLFQMRQYDSTLTELTLYLEQQRKSDQDEKRFKIVYDSKAMTEYMIGLVHIAKGDLPAAREALGRALMEDLSFYMAHARLGAVAAATGDSAAALAEYDLAAQAGAQDASLINDYGIMLLLTGKASESEEQFRKAIAMEPYFADLYLNLAQALDHQGKRDEAVKYFGEFIARAERYDDRLPFAKERMGQLKAGGE